MNLEIRGLVAPLSALALTITACQPLLLVPPGRLPAWTTQLRDAQPDDAFAAVYARRSRRLVFVGAQHANRTESLTFRMIAEAYALFPIDTAIVEGFPHSRGANADSLMNWVETQREADGFVEGGETVPAVREARAQGAKVWGGEPDDTDIRDRVLAQGFSLQDLLGFYTLRSVPQWIRERKISGAGDDRLKALVVEELARNRRRLAAPPAILPGYADWVQWYWQTNHKALGAAFEPEEVGPLADGRYGSNKIAEAISRARDKFLLSVIAQHLNAHESTVVVFGESHLMILRPALEAMLGTPCYLGSDLKSSPARCSMVGDVFRPGQ